VHLASLDLITFPHNTYSRATERNLQNLFNWACSGHERTINQSVRPALIIVINKEEISPDSEWFDIDHATKKLLEPLKASPYFNELQRKWERRGRILKTGKDLILCYYNSVSVVCIPKLSDNTTQAISDQFEKLATQIRNSSEQVQLLREGKGKLLSVNRLCQYTDLALSQLTKDLTSFIDFHYLRKKFHPQPTKFEHHALLLMVDLRSNEEEILEKRQDVDEAALIDRLVPFLAFCIASNIKKLSGEICFFKLRISRWF